MNDSGRVLYRWRCVPKFSNISGAGARPEAIYTWKKIQSALHSTTDAAPDIDPEMGSKTTSWPVSLLMMTAHGWFLRPKAIPLAREGDKKSVNVGKIRNRVYGFLALWLILLVALPISWFGIALLAYLAIATPGLIEIHRQFQNEPDPY